MNAHTTASPIFNKTGSAVQDSGSPDLFSQLAQWCGDRGRVYPPAALQRAQAAICDTIACMLAGAGDPAVTAAAGMFPEVPLGSATSLRHQTGLPAPWAAMINGCAAHALDFDDNFFPAITHASAVLVPALFALAQEQHAGGADIAHAYIVGLEVQAQIGKLVNPGHYESGWHATSTIGTIGAAAACAHLLQLDADGILHAMSVGFSLAGGSKKQFGSMVKPMHAGFAAMHGIMAARLAAAGMKGDRHAMQGRWSFADLFAGSASNMDLVPRLFPAAALAIEEFGLQAKLYPACMSAHLAIDALLALRGKFDVADVECIDVRLPAFMVGNLRYTNPQNEMEARFSMNHCAAIALLYGVPRLAHFSVEAVARAEVQALRPLVRMHVREPFVKRTDLPWGGDCLVSVTLKSHRVYSECVTYPKGCQQNPLTASEQREKFIDCARLALGLDGAVALYDCLANFSRLERITPITERLRPHAAGSGLPSDHSST